MSEWWYVAQRDAPERALVRLRVERPWYWLGLVGRLVLEPLGPDPRWASVVRQHLEGTPIQDGSQLRRPPHTGSASRLAAALRALPRHVPALVAYLGAAIPPAGPPLPSPAEGDPETRRAFLDGASVALARAADQGWGGAPLDGHQERLRLREARDPEQLVAAARRLASLGGERAPLAEALEALARALSQRTDPLGPRLADALRGG